VPSLLVNTAPRHFDTRPPECVPMNVLIGYYVPSNPGGR